MATTSAIERTLGDLVAENPGTARIFERFGLDYCCGGARTLADACAAKALDPAEVEAALGAEPLSTLSPQGEPDWRTASIPDLVDHILDAHHAWLRRELPRLNVLAEKVAAAHVQHHPEVLELRDLAAAFTEEMYAHLAKEEQVLFPMIARLLMGMADATSHCGGLHNPIRVMHHEHDNAGAALERFRMLTNGYTPPDDACPTFVQLMQALHALEQNTHRHVHLENNVLFPRALEL